MFAVKGLFQSPSPITEARIGGEHTHPRHRLHGKPVSTKDVDSGKQRDDSGEAGFQEELILEPKSPGRKENEIRPSADRTIPSPSLGFLVGERIEQKNVNSWEHFRGGSRPIFGLVRGIYRLRRGRLAGSLTVFCGSLS